MDRVSVIMPVWNAEAFLSEAIESILYQTYQNFELIIVDDCSFDNSYTIAAAYAKTSSKIKLFRNMSHLGVSATANKACAHARGQYLARMDADDIAVTQRLEKQLVFLQEHPEIVGVGGQFIIINKNDVAIGRRHFPLTHQEIYPYSFYLTALSQPGLMINRSLLPKQFQYYNEGLSTAEEVELVFKLFRVGPVANLSDTVLYYRIHEANTSLKNPKLTFFLTLLSRIRAVLFLGYTPSAKGILLNLAQILLVGLLPKQLIVFFYRFLRDNPQRFLFSFRSARV